MADAAQMAPMTFDVWKTRIDHLMPKKARVMAAVDPEPQPVQGCHAVRLGHHALPCRGPPAYRAAHFSWG